MGRVQAIVLAAATLVILGAFLVAGSPDPPARLKTRPATATTKAEVPAKPTATVPAKTN